MVQYTFALQVDNQLMLSGEVTIPNNLDTFIINVSISNNGGEFKPSFVFGKKLYHTSAL